MLCVVLPQRLMIFQDIRFLYFYFSFPRFSVLVWPSLKHQAVEERKILNSTGYAQWILIRHGSSINKMHVAMKLCSYSAAHLLRINVYFYFYSIPFRKKKKKSKNAEAWNSCAFGEFKIAGVAVFKEWTRKLSSSSWVLSIFSNENNLSFGFSSASHPIRDFRIHYKKSLGTVPSPEF